MKVELACMDFLAKALLFFVTPWVLAVLLAILWGASNSSTETSVILGVVVFSWTAVFVSFLLWFIVLEWWLVECVVAVVIEEEVSLGSLLSIALFSVGALLVISATPFDWAFEVGIAIAASECDCCLLLTTTAWVNGTTAFDLAIFPFEELKIHTEEQIISFLPRFWLKLSLLKIFYDF